jgi:hypothetical protein
MPYIHKFYTGTCRTYTRCRVESAVRTQGLHQNVSYVLLLNVSYIHKVYSGTCFTNISSTLERAVRTQVLHWNVAYVHKFYTGTWRTYTSSTLERGLRTQVLHWKVAYVHKFYTGTCRMYTSSTLERVVVHKVNASLLCVWSTPSCFFWTFHKAPFIQKLILFLRYDLRFWLTSFGHVGSFLAARI